MFRVFEELKGFFPGFPFSLGVPAEEDFLRYFKWLRNDKPNIKNGGKGSASTTIWCTYSKLKQVIINKYGNDIASYKRLNRLCKKYNVDTKKKAPILHKMHIRKFLLEESLNDAYWLVRKAVTVIMFKGGLRKVELENLKLEDVMVYPQVIKIKHKRAKQRTDKKWRKIPIYRDPLR